MENEPLPAAPSNDSQLLEELAATTGLFNPERIWQKELLLDNLTLQDKAMPPASASQAD